MESVEAEVCPDCGERYFHATTHDEIEPMLEAEHKVKERKELSETPKAQTGKWTRNPIAE